MSLSKHKMILDLQILFVCVADISLLSLSVRKKSELQVSGNYTKAVVTVAVCVDELSDSRWRCLTPAGPPDAAW